MSPGHAKIVNIGLILWGERKVIYFVLFALHRGWSVYNQCMPTKTKTNQPIGFAHHGRALAMARRVSANPYTVQVVEYGQARYLAAGEQLLHRDGTRSRLFYGPAGTTYTARETELGTTVYEVAS